MNILILGAGGFLGKNISEYLNKKKKLFLLFNGKNKIKDNHLYFNLLNQSKIDSFFYNFSKNYKIDIIINLASIVSTKKNKDDINILKKNIIISESVIKITTILNPKKFINFSSMSVYPSISGKYNEKSQIGPQYNSDCLYGISKFSSEILFNYFLNSKKISVLHIRLAQVYGKNMKKERIIPTMIEELKKNNTITLYGKGDRVNNFIHVDELNVIISNILRKRISGILNVGSKNISYIKLANQIIKKHGNNKSKIIKKNIREESKFFLDLKKLKKLKLNI